MTKRKIDRLSMALRLYQSGSLSTGLAARLAKLPIGHFLYELSRHEISPFGTTVDELATDVDHGLAASRVPSLAGDSPGQSAPSGP